jgi:hypothetical protein
MSGRQDSNLRPPGPKPGTLTGLRYAPNLFSSRLLFSFQFEVVNTTLPTSSRDTLTGLRYAPNLFSSRLLFSFQFEVVNTTLPTSSRDTLTGLRYAPNLFSSVTLFFSIRGGQYDPPDLKSGYANRTASRT